MYAFTKIAQKNPMAGVPTNLQDLATYLEKEKNSQDEIGQRRLWWFILAALVKLASERASEKPELRENVTDIWINLVQGGAYILKVLENNVLWTVSEKFFFHT